jgi:signal transduction histidine kinase
MGHGKAFELEPQVDAEAPELSIGEVAQELQLPLQSVRLGVALVRRDAVGASALIKKIDATLQAMERIVDELLDLSRESSGGVGLHIVKSIVEAHRGSVAVGSDQVRTVFRVTLPNQLEGSGGNQ